MHFCSNLMNQEEARKHQEYTDRMMNRLDLAALGIVAAIGTYAGAHALHNAISTNPEFQDFLSDTYVQLGPYIDFLI